MQTDKFCQEGESQGELRQKLPSLSWRGHANMERTERWRTGSCAALAGLRWLSGCWASGNPSVVHALLVWGKRWLRTESL